MGLTQRSPARGGAPREPPPRRDLPEAMPGGPDGLCTRQTYRNKASRGSPEEGSRSTPAVGAWGEPKARASICLFPRVTQRGERVQETRTHKLPPRRGPLPRTMSLFRERIARLFAGRRKNDWKGPPEKQPDPSPRAGMVPGTKTWGLTPSGENVH